MTLPAAASSANAEEAALASAATSPTSPTAPSTSRIGPHPGFICGSSQYSAEIKVRRMLRDNGCDPAREDTYRLQGVQLIDNVREHLQLPVRTFDTACTYFHKFRLCFRDSEYNYQDAALASLFVACKVEDTIKKSRDILAAAYVVKNPEKTVAPDDKIFEGPGKIIIGLERLILETIGFDFRTRYPQKLLVKVVRSIFRRSSSSSSSSPSPSSSSSSSSSHAFFATAYDMCIDLYKTFIPLKRTTLAMVMAVVELTARARGDTPALEVVARFAKQRPQYDRDAVVETMLDLLDLYVQHHRATRLAARIDLAGLIDVKIQLNADLDAAAAPRHLFHCPRCDVADPIPLVASSTSNNNHHHNNNNNATNNSASSATSPSSPAGLAAAESWPPDAAVRRAARGQDGTMRFVFDPAAAREEQARAACFFRDEYEEREVEVEEQEPEPESASAYERDAGHYSSHHHSGSSSGYRGGGGGGSGSGGYRGSYRDRRGEQQQQQQQHHDQHHRRGGGGGGGGGTPYSGHRGDGRYQRGRTRQHY